MTLIDRNNYEEFFLMYVDGELSMQQKNAVELFVQQNPDLENELEKLQQATLSVDEMMVIDKTTLYKAEHGITQTNYTDYFLLYVDNELNDADRTHVETFVLQQPNVQDQFTLLKQTQLPTDVVACPKKELLYKQEEDRKPIVWMNWSRLAVAAAFIAIAVSVWVFYPTKTTTIANGLAVKETINKQTENNQPTIKPATDNVGVINDDTTTESVKPQIATTIASIKNAVAATAKTNVLLQTKKIIVAPVTFKKEETFTNNSVAQASGKDDKKEIVESTTKTLLETLNANKNDIAKTVKEEKENKEIITTSIAQPITYKQLDTDEPENKTVLVGGLEIRKDKLMGLFKKASKTIMKDKDGR